MARRAVHYMQGGLGHGDLIQEPNHAVIPCDIQIGPLVVHEAHILKITFHFNNKPHATFPFSSIQRKGHPTAVPKSE